jgi:peptide/nickel transport system permease protein
LNVPPTAIHLRDEQGVWHWPFIYPWHRVSQLEQQYVPDRQAQITLRWFDDGRLVRSSDDRAAPLLILGADSFGRDVFSRLLFGARTSLALSLVAALGAIALGGVAGCVAGYRGGAVDETLMRGSELILVLPAMYAALTFRAALPLVLSGVAVFVLLVTVFAVLGAPFIARGVRGIIRAERDRDYAMAARSLGAGGWRLVVRHLLPATRGFLVVQLTLLVPGFIVAEATFSYVGLGFPEPIVSWGTMLQEATTARVFTDFPWLLSPAAAMFVVVLAFNLMTQRGRSVGLERPPSF